MYMTESELSKALDNLGTINMLFYNASAQCLVATALNPETRQRETAALKVNPSMLASPFMAGLFPEHISDFVFDPEKIFTKRVMQHFYPVNADGSDSGDLVDLKMKLRGDLHVCTYAQNDSDFAYNLVYGAARSIVVEWMRKGSWKQLVPNCSCKSDDVLELLFTQTIYKDIVDRGLAWDGWESMISAIATAYANAVFDSKYEFPNDFTFEEFVLRFWGAVLSGYCNRLAYQAIASAVWGAVTDGEDDSDFFEKGDFGYQTMLLIAETLLEKYFYAVEDGDDEELPF